MFNNIKKQVHQQFEKIKKHNLYQTQLEHNELFDAYLNALPEDERQSHNCNCCKNFLNRFGGMVSVVNGQVKTLWDFNVDYPYDKVPGVLKAIVESKSIENFLTSETEELGVDYNFQNTDSGVIKWEHFHLSSKNSKCFVFRKAQGDSRDTFLGKAKTEMTVYKRALDELTVEATTTVLDLIAQGNLYRGAESTKLLNTFLNHQKEYKKLTTEREREIFAWENYKENGRVRNSAMGTLLVDLSEGRDLEASVQAYERIMAPTNYKRPTALVTKSMIENAEKRIKQLGIEPALYRRHAEQRDIPIDKLLYVNRNKPTTDLFGSLKEDVPVSPKSFKNIEKVPIDKFCSEIVPNATSIKVLLEPRHETNFVNLIAPVNEDSPNIFNWDNPISWSYTSGTTDSIKQRVEKAGGKTSGILRVSLAWYNYDDLDLSIIEPDGETIYFGHKQSRKTTGQLDVDMNAGSGTTREPVENIIYQNRSKLLKGEYRIFVKNYQKRENTGVGFEVEIASDECSDLITFDKSPKDGEQKLIATINYDPATGFSIIGKTTSKVSSRTVNGLDTNKFHEVSMILNSPNHWDKKVGNLHNFLIFKGAKVDEPVRGLYNEFLKPELNEDRKVFEVLGSKLMVQPSDEQLCGLGFSATMKNSFICQIEGKTFEVTI